MKVVWGRILDFYESPSGSDSCQERDGQPWLDCFSKLTLKQTLPLRLGIGESIGTKNCNGGYVFVLPVGELRRISR
jgi:hypothetical protein